jgi:hypothetical protein
MAAAARLLSIVDGLPFERPASCRRLKYALSRTEGPALGAALTNWHRLAVPVLAGSGAYALGEALGWTTGTTGLGRKPLGAKAFHGTIAVSPSRAFSSKGAVYIVRTTHGRRS